jgi:hypothetical protein
VYVLCCSDIYPNAWQCLWLVPARNLSSISFLPYPVRQQRAKHQESQECPLPKVFHIAQRCRQDAAHQAIGGYACRQESTTAAAQIRSTQRPAADSITLQTL